MLAKRIIPCLDVKNNQVVKGVQFKNHQVVGEIEQLAMFYAKSGADELVFYDITASPEQRGVEKSWVSKIAKHLDISFCVAGGIKTLNEAKNILNQGADKISINSPALSNPALINQLAAEFGSQCVVVGIDSIQINNNYYVCQFTGDEKKSTITTRLTQEWIREVQQRGAGEIVLNCMNEDGCKNGYDVTQLQFMRAFTQVPLIASGGAGKVTDFWEVFTKANVDGALAASVFHLNEISIPYLKNYLFSKKVSIRL